MGKSGRAKWAARIERARKDGAESVSPPVQKRAALVWLRSVSASSICLGGVGLMQTFFWPSIIALYIGVSLLVLDLFFLEQFGHAKWVKLAIIGAIIALTASFTKAVVFRSAPVSASYRVNGDVLEVYVSNDSQDDDYEALDIKIKPDFPSDYVASPEQVTHVPGVSFADPLPSVMTAKGESLLMTVDTSNPSGEAKDAMNNFLRFRCEKLPALTFLRFRMKLVRPVGRTTVPVTEGVQRVLIEGKLKSRYRIFSISSAAIPFPAATQ